MDRVTKGVLDLARSVIAELDLEIVLSRVLESAQQLTGARYAALGVLSASGAELSRFLTLGIDDGTRALIGDLPRGRGVLGELIVHPAPLRLERVGDHRHSWGFPTGHPAMETFLGVPILVDGRPYGNLYLTEKEDGESFTAADEEAVVLLAEFAAVAIGNADRYTGARDRRDELERTVAALDATTQIARAVGGETDLEVILELVAKRGRALVSARTLLIELVRGDSLVVAAGAGDVPADVLSFQVELDETVASAALRTRRTQRLEDDLNRSRFQQHGLGRLGVEAEAGLVVPLVFRDRAYGVLVALDRVEDGPAFTAEDERLLEAFAASAATAVATAESVAAGRSQQRLEASEAERRRWARELHDETLQSLAAMKMVLTAARRTGRPADLEQAVADTLERVDVEVANLRSLITDLRPAALDDYGVAEAIGALAQRMARYGVDVEVDVRAGRGERGEQRLAAELETAMYRIVQEALTNAAKHGHASHATVSIGEERGAIVVSVRDDGSGFDPGAHLPGFGLTGMRERAQLLNGTLSVESAPGAGTRIEAVLPAAPRTHFGGPDRLPRTGEGGA